MYHAALTWNIFLQQQEVKIAEVGAYMRLFNSCWENTVPMSRPKHQSRMRLIGQAIGARRTLHGTVLSENTDHLSILLRANHMLHRKVYLLT